MVIFLHDVGEGEVYEEKNRKKKGAKERDMIKIKRKIKRKKNYRSDVR